MGEAVRGARPIKLAAAEPAFARMIAAARSKEVAAIRRSVYLKVWVQGAGCRV